MLKLALFLLLVAGPMLAEWEKVAVPTKADLRGLSVPPGANVVWASGTGGTVIRSGDGGKTWSMMVVAGAEKLDFRGIHAFDENTAVIISSGPAERGQARIYRTTDGGNNWQQVFEEKRAGIFFDAITFWDRQHGIVLSDPVDGKFALFITDDGGETWKQMPSAALPAALPNEGAFAASNSCLVVRGKNSVWFATGGAKVARVFRSPDRGETWSVAETPMHPPNSSSGIFSLAFLDSKAGVAVGGDYAHPDSSALTNVMLTHDGGKSWTADEPSDPSGVYLSSVAVFPAAGSHVYIAAGTKSGIVMLPAKRIISRPEELNSVAVTSGANPIIWAVGPKGTVTVGKLLVHFFPN